jgi:hypothetical protein
MDIQKIKDYFDEYNAQIKEGGGNDKIDTSGGLDLIMDSIEKLRVEPPYYGLADIWNANAYDGRRAFCKEAALYFIATGEVPDFNANDVLEATKERTIGHIAESFKNYAAKLKEERELLRTSKSA